MFFLQESPNYLYFFVCVLFAKSPSPPKKKKKKNILMYFTINVRNMYLSQKWWFLWLRLVRTWVVKNEGDTSPGSFINWQTFVSVVIIIIMDVIVKVGGFFFYNIFTTLCYVLYLDLQHTWSRFETFEFVLSEYCFGRFCIVPRMLLFLFGIQNISSD